MEVDQTKNAQSPSWYLDKLLVVVTPSSIFFISIALICIMLAGTWLYLGRIPYFVQGSGILLNKEGIKTVHADIEGRVQTVSVHIGDVIQKDQIYGLLTKPVLFKELQNAEQKFAQQIATKKANDNLRKERKAAINTQIIQMKAKVESQKKLLEAKIIIQETLTTAIMNLTVKEQELEILDQEEKEEQIEVDNQRRQRDKLQLDYTHLTTLKSPYAGTVTELMFNEGSVVTQGMPTMILELPTQHMLNATIYIPFAQAKEIKTGMSVIIVPSFLQQNEYGGIQATVETIDTYPASEQAMLNEIQNKPFISRLLKQGVQLKVTASLLKDANTLSTYAWTTPQGAPIQLQSGTFCQAKIRVAEKRPIDLLNPTK